GQHHNPGARRIPHHESHHRPNPPPEEDLRIPKWALALILASIGIAGRASAWDETGHLQVADIAWTRLNDKAKKEIGAILMAGDPITRPASMSDADVRAAFRKAAVFPDTIKFTRTTI